MKDKIVLIKLSGELKQGKTSDINFKQIEDFVKEKKAFIMLKSTSRIIAEKPEIEIEIEDMDKLEEEIIKKYSEKQESKFNSLILPLINSLSLEKQEDETSSTFNSRLFSELNKILNLNLK